MLERRKKRVCMRCGKAGHKLTGCREGAPALEQHARRIFGTQLYRRQEQ